MVQVAMVHVLQQPLLDDRLEVGQVHHHPGRCVNLAAHRHLQRIVMPMPVGVVALAI